MPMDNRRSRVQRLLSALRGHRRVGILGHDNPDPDSIASSLGLSRLLSRSLMLEAPILYSGIVGRTENRMLLKKLGIRLQRVSKATLEKCDGVILVDTQPAGGNNSLPPSVRPLAVIDHHPVGGELGDIPYVDIRPSYGATATIVFEYLLTAGVPLDRDVATTLFYGIKAETLELARRATAAEVKAYTHLFPLVDLRALAAIQHPKVSRLYFEDTRAAMERAFLYDGVIISDVSTCSSPDFVPEMADSLFRLEGVAWSICLGVFGDDLYVSVRTNERDADAGELVQRAMGDLGTAGGHDAMAGGRIRSLPAAPREREALIRRVKDRFLEALGVERRAPVKLLAWRERVAS